MNPLAGAQAMKSMDRLQGLIFLKQAIVGVSIHLCIFYCLTVKIIFDLSALFLTALLVTRLESVTTVTVTSDVLAAYGSLPFILDKVPVGDDGFLTSSPGCCR